jgi:hypothetical protein
MIIADALIIATPVYSRRHLRTLKALIDAILGPYADVTGAHRIKAFQQPGDPEAQTVQIDLRKIKPRVASCIAVAGPGLAFQEQVSYGPANDAIGDLPTSLTCRRSNCSSLVHGCVIRIVIPKQCDRSCGYLRPTYLSQMGQPWEEAKYLGTQEPGSCPYCHQLQTDFRSGNYAVCALYVVPTES